MRSSPDQTGDNDGLVAHLNQQQHAQNTAATTPMISVTMPSQSRNPKPDLSSLAAGREGGAMRGFFGWPAAVRES